MRNLKSIVTSLVATVFVLVFSSCEKHSELVSQDVSFNVKNITDNLKKGSITPDNPTNFPVCSEESPAYVIAQISTSEDGSNPVEYTLNVLQNLEDGTQTQVVKLDPGNYYLTSFLVYDENENLIWASPEEGSTYDELWNLDGVTKKFEVTAFEKHKVDIDVVCWDSYTYKEFGFAWFSFDKIKIKALCFFGDVCMEDHVFWHSGNSPYASQLSYQGYDFPAIFKVVISAGDVIINDEEFNSNLEWFGEGKPLCIEFPDYVGQDDDYKFEIFLMMPDGNYSEDAIFTEEFSAEGDQSDILGDDGIYDFVWGDCVEPPSPPSDVCETAFAKYDVEWQDDITHGTGYVFTSKASDNPDDYQTLDISKRWGWSGNFEMNDPGELVVPLWAGAGKNDTSKGTLVGNVVYKKENGVITVSYNLDNGYTLSEAHTYAGDVAPTKAAPGKYNYKTEDPDSPSSHTFTLDESDNNVTWFISHATVCGDFPEKKKDKK
ncbi:MAG: hypothetical protein KAH10_05020 [Flavobacteriales bacterium]|nr:hypothetical protein [Flavobacteriales bacterium]